MSLELEDLFPEYFDIRTNAHMTAEFNKYFTKRVQLKRDDKNRARKQAMYIIEELAKFVHDHDPKFGKEVIKVGSAFHGLKVAEPDEYDVNIPLVGLDQCGWDFQQRCYYVTRPKRKTPVGPQTKDLVKEMKKEKRPHVKLKEVGEIVIFQSIPRPTVIDYPTYFKGHTFVRTEGTSPRWLRCEDLTFNGDIIPIFVKKKFKKLLSAGVKKINDEYSGKVQLVVDQRYNGPAITVKMTTNTFKMSIDFCVVIDKAGSFPEFAEWPHPDTSWPSQEKKNAISNIGVGLVAKEDVHWKMSTVLAEKELLNGFDDDGGCRKKAHRIMKKLNLDLWSKNKKAISSYALKNLLFWECERFPRADDWVPDMLTDRILFMTNKLHECATEGELLDFFIPTRNLMEKKTRANKVVLRGAQRRIRKFLNDPYKSVKDLNHIRHDSIT